MALSALVLAHGPVVAGRPVAAGLLLLARITYTYPQKTFLKPFILHFFFGGGGGLAKTRFGAMARCPPGSVCG